MKAKELIKRLKTIDENMEVDFQVSFPESDEEIDLQVEDIAETYSKKTGERITFFLVGV